MPAPPSVASASASPATSTSTANRCPACGWHWWLITALWQRVGYGPERYPGVVSDHRHLLRALHRSDVDAAGTLVGAHVIKAKFDLLARMEALRTAPARLRDAS